MKERLVRKEVPAQKAYSYVEMVYVANDGKEFKTEREALNHDDHLRLTDMKRVETNVCDFGYFWYMALNEEELEFMKQQLGFYSKRDYVQKDGNLEVGKWFTVETEYGDNRDTHVFTTLDFIKNSLAELEKELEPKE